MEPRALLDALERESVAMAAAARKGLGPTVAACPGWTVADLLHHTGVVHRFATGNVASRPVRPESYADTERPAEDQLVDWFEAGAGRLRDTLVAADPGEAAWTWFPPEQTVRFWYRRQAQETAVHRWDVEAANGDPSPISGELAADGIDEYLSVFVPRLHGRAKVQSATEETFHFHRSDGPGEWLVRFGPDGVALSRDHAKGDLALRGSSQDLLLFLWGRLPVTGGSLECFGDPGLVGRWFELVPGV
ncbi:MAG: maleylpyruvate isomerase family mycothiol-dependent enzyme [Acidimicrobiales bacterium]